jgi:hypothetical protein
MRECDITEANDGISKYNSNSARHLFHNTTYKIVILTSNYAF